MQVKNEFNLAVPNPSKPESVMESMLPLLSLSTAGHLPPAAWEWRQCVASAWSSDAPCKEKRTLPSQWMAAQVCCRKNNNSRNIENHVENETSNDVPVCDIQDRAVIVAGVFGDNNDRWTRTFLLPTFHNFITFIDIFACFSWPQIQVVFTHVACGLLFKRSDTFFSISHFIRRDVRNGMNLKIYNPLLINQQNAPENSI